MRKLYLKEGQTAPAPDEWGSIAAWAWGLSRAVDYFETDKDVDAKRIAIMGVSRLGKTVLWAGAHDTRIALVIASCSGEGGAAFRRRNYGETIKHLVAPTRYPYQFCANYAQWADKVNESPVDAHMLIALIAPHRAPANGLHGQMVEPLRRVPGGGRRRGSLQTARQTFNLSTLNEDRVRSMVQRAVESDSYGGFMITPSGEFGGRGFGGAPRDRRCARHIPQRGILQALQSGDLRKG